MKTILIATSNKHKKDKLRWIVEDYFQDIKYPDNLEAKIDVVENGSTFKENAQIKAKEYSKVFGGYVIATDGGVLIPAIRDVWNGLHTKRFAGSDVDDFFRIKKLLEIMKDKKGDERKMTWNEAIAVAKGGEILFSKQVEGITGLLQEEFDSSKYQEGIWVCSVWHFPQFNKNFFDLNEKERQEVEISWKLLKNSSEDFFSTI